MAALPHDFPKWKTVYTIFWRWRKAGVWKRIHEALCRLVRKAAGKKPTPSVAIVDSQSIRTAEGGEERGYDAGKKITGRKRHLAVDTLGLIWAVVVHGAYWQDQEGADFRDSQLAALSRLKVIFGDSAYGRDGFAGLGQRHVRLDSSNRACGPCRPKVLWCFPNAGSWSGRSPGWHAAADTAATMNTTRKRARR